MDSPNYPNKFFLYARKSTDVEDMQVQSIDAQIEELHQLAKKEGLEIIEELIEKRSAKTPGRPVFNQMLEAIEKGRANGIISWHPDRLARNSVDGGRIIYLIDTGKLSALKFNTFWFEPTPQGKFMLSISFGQSKYYVDSLSENTSRGLRQKARNGYLPCKAPLGYINDARNKTIIVDKRVAPVITRAFEMYSKGDKKIKDIAGFFERKKVLNPYGNRIDEDKVRKILKKTFYYGVFTYSGEVYEGRHEPIISKKLFDKVQETLAGRNKMWSKAKVKKIDKPYLGLIRCGECGMMVSGEFHKKYYEGTNRHAKYLYYRCSKKHPSIKCNQKYIRNEILEPQLTEIIKKYSLKKAWANQMLLKLKREESDIAQSCLGVIAKKRPRKLARTFQKLDK